MEDESVAHFLLKCPMLQEHRTDNLLKIERITESSFKLDAIEDSDLIVQLILDCTHDKLGHLPALSTEENECYALYSIIIQD